MEKIDIVGKIERKFATKRQRKIETCEAKMAAACSHADFDELQKEIREIDFQLGKALFLKKDTSALLSQKAQLEKNSAKLLKSFALDEQELSPQFDCKVCQDTGWSKGRRCACFLNELNNELFSDSQLPDRTISLETLVPKSDMQKNILKLLKEVKNKFSDTKYKNLLLIGETGTGKSYIINCLANDLIKMGQSVMFASAFSLNQLFLKIYLAPIESKAPLMNALTDTDVLIVDDLGSEHILKNVTEEFLYAVVSERQSLKKHTFITTNCGLDNIQDRYGDRLFSRLANKNNTLVINLSGADLRQ